MILIDVRTLEEYMAGNVPSSIHLPLADIQAGLMPAVDLQEKIVVHCRSGGRAELAMQILGQYGFTNVTNGGGINDF